MAYSFTKATFMASVKAAIQSGLSCVSDLEEREGVYNSLVAAFDLIADELALIDAEI